MWQSVLRNRIFQSTPSAWRETAGVKKYRPSFGISIHSLRMEGDLIPNINHSNTPPISIHSLRMEGDPEWLLYVSLCRSISIHSLRMEGDLPRFAFLDSSLEFQSTPSAWRETRCTYGGQYGIWQFQSTPSAWRETFSTFPTPHVTPYHFNPLPPHGGRPSAHVFVDRVIFPFQSTPSAWRETVCRKAGENGTGNFNPLPPHGGRPNPILLFFKEVEISIHSLRMEGDPILTQKKK